MAFDRAMPVVEVTIGGRGPYRFGIDTGAQGHGRISPALAATLGLTVSGEVLAGDGSGRTQARRSYRADAVALGGITFQGVEFGEMADPRGAQAGVQGILGLGLFARHLLTLDYAGQSVRVVQGALAATAVSYQGEGQIVVPLSIGDIRLPTVIDTGNSVGPLMLPAAVAERLPVVGTPRQIGQARTAISTIAIMEAQIALPIRLGEVALPIDRIGYPALGETGNLGSQALRGGVLRIDQLNRRLELRFTADAAR